MKVFSSSKLKKLFEEYRLWPFLFIIIMEGNLQYFGYILTYDLLNFFTSNFLHKIINLLVIFIGFILLVFGGFIYLFVKGSYSDKNIPLFGNFRNSLIGVSMLIITSNLRNLVLGVLHMLFEEKYYVKVGCLLLAEVIFVFLCMQSTSRKVQKSAIKIKVIVWYQVILPSFIRIFMILIFSLTYIQY